MRSLSLNVCTISLGMADGGSANVKHNILGARAWPDGDSANVKQAARARPARVGDAAWWHNRDAVTPNSKWPKHEGFPARDLFAMAQNL